MVKYLNETYPQPGIAYLDKALSTKCVISFITEIGLQVWQPSGSRDAQVYRDFITSAVILGIDEITIKETIRIRKKHKLKIPDAIIAATAIMNELILISDNEKDFNKIHGLDFANPSSMLRL